MTPEILFPGVYVEEIPSGAQAIRGVATSVAAFVGQLPRGPVGEALAVGSLAELERRLGGPPGDGRLVHAVAAFFDNGGKRALVVRVDNGSRAAVETGLAALTGEDWNLLCLPPAAAAAAGGGTGGLDAGVIAAAAAFCEQRRALLIVDADTGWGDAAAALAGRAALGLDSRNAALYYPWLRRPGTSDSFPPSGAVAGVYARTDAARGVWKAPAGADAVLRGASGLSVTVTERETGELNQAGINCLRVLPAAGPVIWGARTTSSNPEWKYVPVRRLALFLERSVDEGTGWAVFEPNDQPLWDRLRQSVETFLHSLWREGAFQGAKPEDAFFVRCDRTTTTQAEIDQGVVNVQLGFAPLKPAEFIILRIVVRAGGSQPAGGSQKALENLAVTAADLGGRRGERRSGGPALMALFSGPSGTGKTLAARGLARRLERVLFRVALAEVAWETTGEAEKNLERLFDLAERRGGILFFDEADALFGKRSKVRDAHDRYANIEVSYLLRRLSEFHGVVILATNRPAIIDPAFSERSRFRVEFD